MDNRTAAVREFWERASCGEELYLNGRDRSGYERQARIRYELEPFIPGFARFNEARGKRALEELRLSTPEQPLRASALGAPGSR